jgi:hypothetical protein
MAQRVNEVLVEPKRATMNLDSLGLGQDAGVPNIVAVYNQATPAEKDYWGRWYHHAQYDCQELAKKYDLPFRIVAAVVAVLSPGCNWHGNVLSADRLLAGHTNGIPAYPANQEKARAIMATHNPALVTGPKVSVFYQSLLNPAKLENEMVLDGHAINIWRGNKVNLKSVPGPANEAAREQMVNDYKQAARQLGVSVQSVQAVTWFTWRYSSHQG